MYITHNSAHVIYALPVLALLCRVELLLLQGYASIREALVNFWLHFTLWELLVRPRMTHGNLDCPGIRNHVGHQYRNF